MFSLTDGLVTHICHEPNAGKEAGHGMILPIKILPVKQIRLYLDFTRIIALSFQITFYGKDGKHALPTLHTGPACEQLVLIPLIYRFC